MSRVQNSSIPSPDVGYVPAGSKPIVAQENLNPPKIPKIGLNYSVYLWKPGDEYPPCLPNCLQCGVMRRATSLEHNQEVVVQTPEQKNPSTVRRWTVSDLRNALFLSDDDAEVYVNAGPDDFGNKSLDVPIDNVNVTLLLDGTTVITINGDGRNRAITTADERNC